MACPVYLDQLRQHTHPGLRHTFAADHEHLDSTAFWRQAYEKSEAAQAKLLNKIYELELLKQLKGDGSESFEALRVGARGKRKRSEKTTAKANSQSKRRATPTRSIQLLDVTTDVPSQKLNESDDEGLKKGASQNILFSVLYLLIPTGSTAFVRQLFDLRQLISAKQTSPQNLSSTLRMLCRAASAMLSHAIDSTLHLPSQIKKSRVPAEKLGADLTGMTVVIRRSYMFMLQGLEKLSIVSTSSSDTSPATFEFVHLFDSTLRSMSRLVLQKAKEIDEVAQPRRVNAMTRSQKSTKRGAAPFSSHHEVCQSLAQLLVHMVTSLDPSKSVHGKVLESLICVFLDQLGSSLSLVVFADHEASLEGDQLLGISPPRGLWVNSDCDTRTAVKAAQIEAPYLVYVLEELMGYLDHRQAITISRSATLCSLKKDHTISDGLLAQRLKEKLQCTLLKGVFGEDDEAFQDSLRPPKQLESEISEDPPDSSQQEDTSKWYTSEVWRILGWDILAERASF